MQLKEQNLQHGEARLAGQYQLGEGAKISRVLEESLSDNEAPVELSLGLLVLILNGLEDSFQIIHIIVLVVLDMGTRNNDSLLDGESDSLITFFEDYHQRSKKEQVS